MNIKQTLNKYKIAPDLGKDQFFLTDTKIIKKAIEFADLNKNDTVLEIGAGPGNLTKKLAEKAGRVIAFEIDTRFKPLLKSLPKNTEVRYENAWKYIQLRGKWKKKKEYNKVVSNIPYSLTEPFLHNLTFLNYDKVILLVPIKFLKKIDKHSIFGSFFQTKILLKVPKESFYPTPRTNSVLIELIKLPDPLKTKNSGLFLRQYIYQHENQLAKNSLMEGIIKYSDIVHSKKVTKNEARNIISKQNIPKELLEKTPSNPSIYSLAENIII